MFWLPEFLFNSEVTLPRVIPPAGEVVAGSPSIYLDYFRVRIDPAKSGETNRFLRYDFADGSSAGLHIRRAVAEFVASPDDHYREPDVVLAMKRDYIPVSPLPNATEALKQIAGWFEDYNENHPHSGLKMRSPREFRRALNETA